MAAGKVTISTTLDNSGLRKGYQQASSDTDKFSKHLGASVSKGTGQAGKALEGLKRLMASVLSVTLVFAFGKASVQAARQFSDAMTGMQSILEGQGRSFAQAQGFINEYISDGLMPATNAITAYKNLVLRGYDDSQIQTVLVALKNAAAYGRQASYTMGEAIASASEGLKNENSILVDNAGVTKNVAKMWEEYARSIGTTASNLTQQQKIQAEVNGILAETRFQAGDAAKVAGTFSGQIMQLQFGFTNLKVALGNALIPIIRAILPAVNAAIAALTGLFNVFSQVTSAIFGGSASEMKVLEDGNAAVADSAYSGAEAEQALGAATKQAAKDAKGALASFDELNVLQQNTGADGSDGAAASGASGGGVTVAPAETAPPQQATPPPWLEGFLKLTEPARKAVGGLKVELDRLGGFAWQALVDFYDRFLAPVGTWVMGIGLPRFIDAITNGLAAINWGKVNDALATLWDALAPLSQTIGGGLLWFWENVLVPLGTWVIGDALPVFLGAVASVVEGLDKSLRAVGEAFAWLWDNALVYIAGFVGEVIVDFFAWIAQNGEFLATVVFAIVAAVVAYNTAMAIYNTVTGIAAAVTNALAAPISLVTLAIIALIAVIILCVIYWDEIVAAAQYCWDCIVSFFSGLAQWFYDTVILPIVTFFTDLWNGIVGLATAAWDGIVGVWTVVSSWFYNTLIAPIANFFKGMWDGIVGLATGAWNLIQGAWQAAADWFNNTIVQPIANFFGSLWEGIQTGASVLVDFIQTWVIDPIVNAFKFLYNGVVGIFEGIINGFIGIINGFISGINGVIWAINLIPFVDIPEIPHLAPMNIPRLAQGAVIPPNREFMAVLGDQHSGTNIEAPLETIMDAMRIVMGEGGGAGREITINFAGSLAEFVRNLKPYIDKENSRVGGSLIARG